MESYQQQLHDLFRQTFADGTAPWLRDYSALDIPPLPVNGSTGREFSGDNQIFLLLNAAARGQLTEPRWFTATQAAELSATPRPGEQAAQAVFWQTTDLELIRDAEGKPLLDATGNHQFWETELDQPRLTTAALFHASQIDGLPPYTPDSGATAALNSRDALAALQDALGVKVQQVEHLAAQPCAHYFEDEDLICISKHKEFETPDAYYSALLHGTVECVASRHHAGLVEHAPVGAKQRDRDDLAVSIAAYCLSAKFGLGHQCPLRDDQIERLTEDLRQNDGACGQILRQARAIQDAVDLELTAAIDRDKTQVAKDASAFERAFKPCVSIIDRRGTCFRPHGHGAHGTSFDVIDQDGNWHNYSKPGAGEWSRAEACQIALSLAQVDGVADKSPRREEDFVCRPVDKNAYRWGETAAVLQHESFDFGVTLMQPEAFLAAPAAHFRDFVDKTHISSQLADILGQVDGNVFLNMQTLDGDSLADALHGYHSMSSKLDYELCVLDHPDLDWDGRFDGDLVERQERFSDDLTRHHYAFNENGDLYKINAPTFYTGDGYTVGVLQADGGFHVHGKADNSWSLDQAIDNSLMLHATEVLDLKYFEQRYMIEDKLYFDEQHTLSSLESGVIPYYKVIHDKSLYEEDSLFQEVRQEFAAVMFEKQQAISPDLRLFKVIDNPVGEGKAVRITAPDGQLSFQFPYAGQVWNTQDACQAACDLHYPMSVKEHSVYGYQQELTDAERQERQAFLERFNRVTNKDGARDASNRQIRVVKNELEFSGYGVEITAFQRLGHVNPREVMVEQEVFAAKSSRPWTEYEAKTFAVLLANFSHDPKNAEHHDVRARSAIAALEEQRSIQQGLTLAVTLGAVKPGETRFSETQIGDMQCAVLKRPASFFDNYAGAARHCGREPLNPNFVLTEMRLHPLTFTDKVCRGVIVHSERENLTLNAEEEFARFVADTGIKVEHPTLDGKCHVAPVVGGSTDRPEGRYQGHPGGDGPAHGWACNAKTDGESKRWTESKHIYSEYGLKHLQEKQKQRLADRGIQFKTAVAVQDKFAEIVENKKNKSEIER